MKLAALLLALVMLTGCRGHQQELERAMGLRTKLLTSSCSFDAEIAADYGHEVHTFGVYCETDNEGNLGFRITSPETIADITGRVRSGAGELTFQDKLVGFPLLAEEQLSPVSAPWVFYTALRSGYLTAAGMEEDLLWLTIDDSYEENALTVDIWLNNEDVPVRAEFLYDGRRILTMVITNFRIV